MTSAERPPSDPGAYPERSDWFRSAIAAFSQYHRTLLALARRQIDKGEYRFAVILAQTSCEFLTEQVISHLLKVRGAEYLEEWIQERLRPCHVGIDAVRELFTILPLDGPVQFSPAFKKRYEDHVHRRNVAVHRGEQLSKGDAEESCAVAAELIALLEPQLGGKLILQPPVQRPKEKQTKKKPDKDRHR